MGKSAVIITPLYLGIAWTLMITYQLFTSMAVNVVLNFIKLVFPNLGYYLLSIFDLIVFIHSFAWIFLISSAIPSKIFGNKRSIFLQFLICLILSLSPLIFQKHIPALYYNISNDYSIFLNILFNNYFFSFIYLISPYLFMILIDMN